MIHVFNNDDDDDKNKNKNNNNNNNNDNDNNNNEDDDKIPIKQKSEFVLTSVTQLPPGLSVIDRSFTQFSHTYKPSTVCKVICFCYFLFI